MKTEIFRSIQEIDRLLWDSIIETNSMTKCYDFLLSVELAMNIENDYWYVLFWENNELTAHTCLFTHLTKLEEVTNVLIPNSVINKIRKYYKKFLTLKILGCGTPIATCSNVLTIKNEKYIESVTEQINIILEDIGKKQRISSMMIRDFSDDNDKYKSYFMKCGYKIVESLPTSFVKIEWEDFEQYVESFKSKVKVKTRRNIKKFNEGNLKVKLIEDFDPYVEDMLKLYQNVYDKADNKFEKLNQEFFRYINIYLEKSSKAMIVFLESKIVGIELIMEDDNILRPLYLGIDYEYNEQYRLYFNMIYQIIKIGIEKKKDYVELGQTCYYPKIKAGAYVQKMHMYIKFRNKLLNKVCGNIFYKMFENFVYKEKV